jgi:S-(hydroxymethyl)glutathione dehydrogenase/alcohol dehydrogenase
MSIDVIAAVAFEANAPLQIETLQLDPPGAGEVLIEIKATGLCHSDLHAIEGKTPQYPFPMVCGHEGAGIVVECGPGVSSVQPGDHVIPAATPECRQCRNCISHRTNFCLDIVRNSASPRKYRYRGREVTQFAGCSTFAQMTVVGETSVAKIPKDVPFDIACYVACGVLTGVGAAVYGVDMRVGDSVAVFGLGGIGLNVLQGARIVGATKIIGIDTNPGKEAIARQFGMTHYINPGDTDVLTAIRDLTGGGVDFAFECVGNTKLLLQAINATQPGWGTTIGIGITGPKEQLEIVPNVMLTGRSWRGLLLGGARPRTHIPQMLEWYQSGVLRLDELITHRLPLSRINDGFDLMRRGESIRSVVVY